MKFKKMSLSYSAMGCSAAGDNVTFRNLLKSIVKVNEKLMITLIRIERTYSVEIVSRQKLLLELLNHRITDSQITVYMYTDSTIRK